jgi:CMP/dCMP kinase
MALVTVSRQCGSGGREIAKAVAEVLDATYVDQELISVAAQRIGVGEDDLADRDERVAGPTQRLIDAVGMAFSVRRRGESGGQARGMADLTDMEIVAATRRIIREIAAAGNAVFLGRGSEMVLRENPRALHVHVVAPLKQRIATIMRRENLQAGAAEQFIARLEADRAAYLRTHYGADWEDPENYHVVINTALLRPEQATEAIALMAGALDEAATAQLGPEVEGQTFEDLFLSFRIMRDAARASIARYSHRL